MTAHRDLLERTDEIGTSLVVIKIDLVEQQFGKAEYRQSKHKINERNAFGQGYVAGQAQEINKVVE